MSKILDWKTNIKEVEILERETAKTILEDKQINFPKLDQEGHNLLQTPVKIKKGKITENRQLFKACFCIF